MDTHILNRVEPLPPAPHATDALEPSAVVSDWRDRLPMLHSRRVTLRELRPSDAASLCRMLSVSEVTRFISPPPTTVEGYERFIAWTTRQRAAGRSFCYGIVPEGCSAAVGLIQVRALDDRFSNAEWGFAIGSPYWGTGMFLESATMVIEMAFETVGIHRLEARAAVANGRGLGALRKLGAVEEARLRRSFRCNGEVMDQVLWSIAEEDWNGQRRVQAKTVWGSPVH